VTCYDSRVAVTLSRTSLNDRVYETIKRRLVRRELGPGEKVSLHELAAELGVSRSPVHHALTRLVSEGLLSVKARRGYYVQALTAKALEDGYDVRLALELHAAEVAVGRTSPAELARFRELLEATTKAVSHEDWDAANAAFHEHQVDLAGNALLSRFYRDLSVNLMMQVIRGGRLEARAYLATEHRAIVEAFEAGDVAAAKTAIAAHIATGKRIALAALAHAGGIL
jgi:DNA-binding GntR family transcriptional regulator